MSWSTTTDVEEFLSVAGDFLRSRPVENTVMLTVTDGIRTRGFDGQPVFGWWRTPEGAIGSAFMRTPPYPLMLTQSPDRAVIELAQAFPGPLSGVNAPTGQAELFAEVWHHRTGVDVVPGMRSRLYRLGTLVAPSVPGTARVADEADRDLLLAWLDAFGDDIGERSTDNGPTVDARLRHGGLTLWEVDGVPVSMAGNTLNLAGVVRVAPVYTPPAQRRRGYAGAVTAAVTRAALDAGAEAVVLFTDLDNPTSNSVYTALGYRPVHDRLVLQFESTGEFRSTG